MFAARPEISSPFSLKFSEESYADLFRHAGDAMLLVSAAAGMVVDLNPAAMRLFRAEPAARFPFRTAGEYSQRAASGETVRYTWRFLRQDQTEFDADITLSRLGDSEDGLQLAIIREVKDTLPAEAEARLRHVTAQLDAVAAELDAFSYAVSHDLRAGISGIAACSRIVMDDFAAGMNEDARRWLGHIHDDAEQLDRLTHALIELSRVSRSRMEPVDLDLTSLASEVVGELRDQGKNHQFLVSDGIETRADHLLMRVLLRNLLGNAAKFTPNTPDARIEFGRLGPDTSGRGPVFFVRDNGMGFDMAYADRLFVPFQRLHNDGDLGGSGIGLAIVRRIVNRHGGEVWAEAKPGGGAGFFFTLDGFRR